MRPDRIVLVLGTGTEVGKTWVSARLLAGLRQAGVSVAARKPAQSFEAGDAPTGLDAALLGSASGEPAAEVCQAHRCYEIAMAPPMAAAALGRAEFTVADLVRELRWPEVGPGRGVAVGLVESAGGVRSPQAFDGDAVALAEALRPDLTLLVADAGLGTINAVRLSAGVLTAATPLVVVLNRFDEANDLHVANWRWLTEQDGYQVVRLPTDEGALVGLARGNEAAG
jgi:dethiobiotin synthetase